MVLPIYGLFPGILGLRDLVWLGICFWEHFWSDSFFNPFFGHNCFHFRICGFCTLICAAWFGDWLFGVGNEGRSPNTSNEGTKTLGTIGSLIAPMLSRSMCLSSSRGYSALNMVKIRHRVWWYRSPFPIALYSMALNWRSIPMYFRDECGFWI